MLCLDFTTSTRHWQRHVVVGAAGCTCTPAPLRCGLTHGPGSVPITLPRTLTPIHGPARKFGHGVKMRGRATGRTRHTHMQKHYIYAFLISVCLQLRSSQCCARIATRTCAHLDWCCTHMHRRVRPSPGRVLRCSQ